MRYNNTKFLQIAKKSARPNNNGLVTLTQDPVTKSITLPDGTPVNVKPFHIYPDTGDLAKIVRSAQSCAANLHLPLDSKDCVMAVFYRQHGISDNYYLEYYAIPKS